MPEVIRPLIHPTTEDKSKPTKLMQCGALMAIYFRNGSSLLLDVDGVICKANSLDYPQLATPNIIKAIRDNEDLGIKVGLATARGDHIIDFLRKKGCALQAFSILEEGQLVIKEGKKETLSHPSHPGFIRDLREELKLHESFQSSRQMVRQAYEANGRMTFCPGNFQWQGDCRASFWFFSTGEKEAEQQMMAAMLAPDIAKIAERHRLDPKRDLFVGFNRISRENLGIISIKGKKETQPINKGTAAKKLSGPWVFVADGFGDTQLAEVTKKENGCVIGIEGNLDDSNEPPDFLRNADYALSNPEELAIALQYAALCLKD